MAPEYAKYVGVALTCVELSVCLNFEERSPITRFEAYLAVSITATDFDWELDSNLSNMAPRRKLLGSLKKSIKTQWSCSNLSQFQLHFHSRSILTQQFTLTRSSPSLCSLNSLSSSLLPAPSLPSPLLPRAVEAPRATTPKVSNAATAPRTPAMASAAN